MEAIDTKAIKDAVAKKYGYNNWDEILRHFRLEYLTFIDMKHVENEVISEVAKQVAESQRMICADKAQEYYESINYIGILNAPIPEII